jgi:hypothetical protein
VSDRLRASDEERERAVAALRRAAGEGRLTVDELDERTARAYAARTRGELDRLLEDLPAPPVPAPPPRPAPRMPGRSGFSARWIHEEPPDLAIVDILHSVAPPLRDFGYRLAERRHDRLVFQWQHRPVWTILAAIFLFPFGLLALLHVDREHITIEVARAGRETVCVAHGVAPLAVRRAFARLGD